MNPSRRLRLALPAGVKPRWSLIIQIRHLESNHHDARSLWALFVPDDLVG